MSGSSYKNWMINESKPQIKYDFLDNKQIVYHDKTEFIVQWGKNKKSAYDTKWVFVGNLGQALMWYKALNICYPHKKRLYSPSMKPSVLAREWAS